MEGGSSNDPHGGKVDNTPTQSGGTGIVPVDDYPMCAELPFAHGVASGDPLTDRVIIWTRVTLAQRDPNGTPGANMPGEEPEITWKVATDPGMSSVVKQGSQRALAQHDWTIKVDVTGLEPGTTYYYQFTHEGTRSMVGRTRTAAGHGVDQVRMAVLSCSSYWSAYWGGLGHLAKRNDVDLVVHLGDYIYDFIDKDEMVRFRAGAGANRLDHPDNRDWKNLDEVRRRYALHHSDANWVRCHQQHPWTILWDNHDIDPFDGNELTIPDVAIPHTCTLMDTMRAFWEWTPSRPVLADGSGRWLLIDDGSYPVPEDPSLVYRRVDYGDLVSVIGLDAQQGIPKYDDVRGELHKPRTDHLPAGKPSLMGTTQYNYLIDNLQNAQDTGVVWKTIAQQTFFTAVDIPDIVEGSPGSELIKFGLSRWVKYPAEKKLLVDYLRANISNTVMISGDAHGSLGADLLSASAMSNPYVSGVMGVNQRPGAQPGNLNAGAVRTTTGNRKGKNNRWFSAGVEFAPTSMGRGGADDQIGGLLRVGSPAVIAATRAAEQALMGLNFPVQYFEWADHGYGLIHYTRESATFEYWFQNKFDPNSRDVLAHQMIAWAKEDTSHEVPRYPHQMDAVTLHGLPVQATVGTRTSEPAPDAVLQPR
ncbi:alkaline phosphatase D family protein [Corynebacterium aquatimens]